MFKLEKSDFEQVTSCPWCGDVYDNNTSYLYTDYMGCDIVKCHACSIVYAHKRLNSSGLSKYWNDYLSRVHLHNKRLVEQRNIMYQLDYDLINKYISNGNVLDVGCGKGDFLQLFKNNGFTVEGVEYGHEAAIEAARRFTIYEGEFDSLNLIGKYDLIIFRGVLQYLPNPKSYLNKAFSLLKPKGIIFITAQPNLNSFCAKLFKENFSLAVTGADFIGYNKDVLNLYMSQQGFELLNETFFYEETPYANIKDDVIRVAEAIKLVSEGKPTNQKSPAFWGNMLSLIYKKL